MTEIENFVKRDHIHLWVEGIGDTSNPAVILISGAGASARFWTDTLCKKISTSGYFVIRFDHRDTGLSSAVDWEKNPYTIKDLAEDVIAILDFYHIKKAHVVDHSMGGTIAQLLAIDYPKRILSYTSMSVATVDGNTTQPSDETMAALLENKPTQNFEESLEGFMRSWRILSGDLPLDEAMAKEYTHGLYHRSKHLVGVAWNHICAQENIGDLSKKLSKVSIPGLFIHGEKDPLIPVQGGINTANAANAKMESILKMGHLIFNQDLQNTIASLLLQHFSKSESHP